VTPNILVDDGSGLSSDTEFDFVLSGGGLARLRGPGRLHFRMRLRLLVEQAEPPRGLWEARPSAYEYRLSDHDDREIVAYHWHPEGAPHVQTPHLHLGPAAEIGYRALTTAHLPTGWVAVDELIHLAIDSLGAELIRRDWERVLREPTARA
jgi:hypothetical protein